MIPSASCISRRSISRLSAAWSVGKYSRTVARLGRPWTRATTSSGSKPCFQAPCRQTRVTAGVESIKTPVISALCGKRIRQILMRQHSIRFTCVYCIIGFEFFLVYTSKPAATLTSLYLRSCGWSQTPCKSQTIGPNAASRPPNIMPRLRFAQCANSAGGLRRVDVRVSLSSNWAPKSKRRSKSQC